MDIKWVLFFVFILVVLFCSKWILLFLLRGYKRFISPLLGDNCRFKPTCSEYAMQAIQIHGSAKGLVLTIWRLLRCNPFGKVGYDPPPEKHRWKNDKRRTYREGARKEHKGHTHEMEPPGEEAPENE